MIFNGFLSDTTAIFRSHATLWPGVYHLFVEVRDQQGKFCVNQQVLQVEVCACDASQVCLPRQRDSRFGAAGVFLMLLGLLLILCKFSSFISDAVNAQEVQ